MGNIGAIFGTHDENTLAQLQEVAESAERVALMADGHLGYEMPIGGVAAYRDMVSVTGVGFDIACGNAAIRTDMQLNDLGKSQDKLRFMLDRFADEIQQTISFGVGRNNNADDAPTDLPLFDSADWYRIKERAGNGEMRRLNEKARSQLGTVGSGNHYVDVFADETGAIWVGVHFGSRGFGHGVASGFLAVSSGKDWHERVKESESKLLSLHSSAGEDYWTLMNMAGEYAYAGREWVARKVVQILGARELELVHNHHNFAWKEEHFGEEFVVVRKGATPAFPGQKGFVGGSMGDDSVILEGSPRPERDEQVELGELQKEALFSTVHGAGRVMSRTAAAGKIDRKTREQITPGLISPEMMTDWLRAKNVVLRGGGLDEAPQAYRRLPDVLAAQQGTVNVLHTLTPLIVVMAGKNEFDPYKD